MKSIKVKRYDIPTKFGNFVAKNVELLVYDEKVTKKSFNPRKHEHAISTSDALAAEHQAARIFLKDFYKKIRVGERLVDALELAGIMLVCNLKAIEFSKLLGISKGQMSKLLKNSNTSKTVSIAAIDLLLNELRLPGYAKILLETADQESSHIKKSGDTFIERLLSESAA